MRSISVCLLASALALGSGSSCGGDDSDGSGDDGAMCSGDTACGGALEGSWKLANACYTTLKQPEYPGCSDVTAELSAKTSGNVTFLKDTYDRHMQVDMQLTFNFSAKCKADKKRECKDFEGTLSNGAMLACKDADGGCTCSAEVPSTTNESGGAYSIRGNRVELTGDTFDYCVKGDKLALKPTQPAQSGDATSEVQYSFDKN